MRNATRTSGFTLIELLVSVTLVAAIAAVVIPRMSDDSAIRLRAASSILTSDLEYAQVRSISKPDAPLIVRFDTAKSTYWLATPDDPDTPVAREDNGQPYLVTFGEGRGGPAGGVMMQLTDVADDTLRYDSQGGLDDFSSEPMIVLTVGSQAVRLAISPMTGTITEVEEEESKEESLGVK